MKPKETYTVREFARLAGVTVRTLHFYDQNGLLKPTEHTAKRYRLYRQHDLMRLQQILTLKYMGFTLDEARELLNSPTYELEKSLRIQKAAVEARIAELQQVTYALDMTIQSVAEAGEPDWKLIAAIIQGVSEGSKWRWVNAYYTPEQQNQIAVRGQQFSTAEMVESWAQWARLIDDFSVLRHLPAEHADVQVLAAEMNQLILAFTGGDPGIEQSLRSAYENADQHFPTGGTPFDRDLQRFMGQAFDIYRTRNTDLTPQPPLRSREGEDKKG